MAYIDYYRELLGWVPKLDIFLAQKLVNRSWQDIREAHHWSFNVAEGSLTTPAIINAGTVTVTQASATVVGTVAAAAAWDAIPVPTFIQRQFRAGNGPVYNISSYTSPTITLDRPYGETTASGASYQIYQCYYDPPSTDFLRFISVIDSVNGYQLSLHHTKQELDLKDPIRGATGEPHWVVSYRGSIVVATLGNPVFELYPHPNIFRIYPVLYQRRGIDFSLSTDALPGHVNVSTLMARARWHAYRWAMGIASQDRQSVSQYAFLIKDADTEYKRQLEDDIRKDKEVFSQMVPTYVETQYGGINRYGSYAMDHDVSGGWNG